MRRRLADLDCGDDGFDGRKGPVRPGRAELRRGREEQPTSRRLVRDDGRHPSRGLLSRAPGRWRAPRTGIVVSVATVCVLWLTSDSPSAACVGEGLKWHYQHWFHWLQRLELDRQHQWAEPSELRPVKSSECKIHVLRLALYNRRDSSGWGLAVNRLLVLLRTSHPFLSFLGLIWALFMLP